MVKKLLLVAALLTIAIPAAAQVQAPQVTVSWLPLGKISAGISVTVSAGAATALPTGGETVYVFNTGSNDAFVAVGASGVAASATASGSTLVKAGTCANINRRNISGTIQGYISAVTASSTTTLAVETGIGSASCSGGSSGGGGGGGGTSSSFNAGFPGTGTAIGFSDPSSNMKPGSLDVSGNLKTAVQNFNPNGQTTMAGSAPVAIASNQTALPVGKASASGGATPHFSLFLGNTTGVVLKNAAGTLYSCDGFTIGAVAYLKFYDKATAPTNSDTPIKVVAIPVAGTAANGAGNICNLGTVGLAFANGISYRIVTGIANNDNTAPTVSTGLVNASFN